MFYVTLHKRIIHWRSSEFIPCLLEGKRKLSLLFSSVNGMANVRIEKNNDSFYRFTEHSRYTWVRLGNGYNQFGMSVNWMSDVRTEKKWWFIWQVKKAFEVHLNGGKVTELSLIWMCKRNVWWEIGLDKFTGCTRYTWRKRKQDNAQQIPEKKYYRI